MQQLVILLLFFIAQLSNTSFSDSLTDPDKAELSREANLKKYPTADAISLGKLPKGTIIELSGEEENNFAEIDAEMTDGTVLTGWAEIRFIKGREREKIKEPPQAAPRGNKIVVPKSEGVLLKRDPTFFYGVNAGGNYSILGYSEDADPFIGMSFQGGAHVGLYFNPYARAQAYVGYFRTDGKDLIADALGFGFLDVNFELQIVLEERILILAGVGYLRGIGITAAPTTILLEGGAADVSTPYGTAGLGYRVAINDLTRFGLKASYLFGFQRDVIGIQGFLINAFIDFEG